MGNARAVNYREHPAEITSRRLRLPAWLLSVFLHTTVLLTVGMALRSAPRGAAPKPEIRQAGIVLVQPSTGEREYFDGQQQLAASSPVTSSESTPSEDVLPDEAEITVDLAGELPAPHGDGSGNGQGGLPDAADLSGGPTAVRGPGGTTKTRVFGVTGEGSRFVYVFDRSGSMEGFGGRPLRTAKRELLASLDDLDRIHRFQIIFYNEQPRIFGADGGKPQMVWGDAAGKQLASRFVRGIDAAGGTRHMEALMVALRLSPDVVFFLTDADEPEMSAADLARIRRANRSASINAIEFGYGPQQKHENFLVRLARQNNGRHVYVDISKLPE